MSSGASPAGVRPGDEAAASRSIREMFGRVAPRYDLLNRLLSARVDVFWRRKLLRSIEGFLGRPRARILDVCCGTGDVAAALERSRNHAAEGDAAPTIASDFCRPMLLKVAGKAPGAVLIEADAMRFPAADGTFDAITIAFGFRNLTHYRRGLDELHRILAPGGRLAILEFSRPENRLWGPLFEWYFRNVLPRIGNALSGAGDAYSYLQGSVERFLSPEELAAQMRDAGFETARYERLTGGICCLHVGDKPNNSGS